MNAESARERDGLRDEPGGHLLLGKRMHAVFGTTPDEFEHDVANSALSKFHIETAHRVVLASGAPAQLAGWKAEARRSNAGAKPLISPTAVLTLFLAHALAGRPITYLELATTLRLRLKHDQRALLGITHRHGSQAQWYDRMWAAVNRLIELVDPYPGPRNRILRGQAWSDFHALTQTQEYLAQSRAMNDRFDELINSLVRASVDLLPRDIWATYNGGQATDATRVGLPGRPNAASSAGDRSNPDPLSGRYRREGDHDGLGAKTDEAAYELETAVMVWNEPGATTLFPSLVTAVTMHNPGVLRGHGARLIDFHKRYGFDRFLAYVDRAYNGGTIESFHMPGRLAGVEFVFEYKKTELGLQGWYEDLILVDGNWYVNWMPPGMITATRELRDLNDGLAAAHGALTVASRRNTHTAQQLEQEQSHRDFIANARHQITQLRALTDNRTIYRMKEHGLPDADGAQRFRYPNPENSLTTPTPNATRNSITIPMIVPETDAPSHLTKARPAGSPRKPQPIKFVQKYPYESPEWNARKGLRNLVEASNRLLKKGTKFNIADPDQRSGRGYAFTYLSVALAVVADNIHRIRAFFYAEAQRADDAAKPKTRARRRKDANGTPLPRRQPANTGPPR